MDVAWNDPVLEACEEACEEARCPCGHEVIDHASGLTPRNRSPRIGCMTTTTMNPEIKAEWVAALRSGEYKQGIAALRKGGLGSADGSESRRYCCLGVLCDLFVQKGKGEWLDGNDFRYLQDEAVSGGYVPGDLAEEIGLDWGAQYSLSARNDHGASFAEIANIIEGTL